MIPAGHSTIFTYSAGKSERSLIPVFWQFRESLNTTSGVQYLMPLDDFPTHSPRLFRVIVPVNDIDKAEEFYTSLLAVSGKRVSPGRHYFNCHGTILACFDPRADTDNFDLSPNPDHIYLSVKDLDEVYDRAVKLGGEILDHIDMRPWGEQSFYMKDPFGNKLCFVNEKTVFTGD